MSTGSDASICEDQPRCIWQGAALLGEGPLWSLRDRALYWVDILGCRLHRRRDGDASVQTWEFPEHVSAVFERRSGSSLVLSLRSHLAYFDPATGTLDRVLTVEPERPDNRLNDGKCDAQGRLWMGSMSLTGRERTGAVYRCDASASTRHLDGYSVCNGPTWSLDGKTMYFSDSIGRQVLAFDFDPTSGTVANSRIWARFSSADGCPDGLATDSLGRIWVAQWGAGRVSCFTSEGTMVGAIDLPVSHVTSCAFGGEDLRTLYITTARTELTASQLEQQPLAGGLFTCRVKVSGLPPNYFAT